MSLQRKFSLIFFIVLSYLIGNAQTINKYYFDSNNEEQGLIHSYVLSIYQDSRNLLWVGSYGGVQAFNGYEFNSFNVFGKKSNILSNAVVNVIYEDHDHNMWFGTENGLNKYDVNSGKITLYQSNEFDSNSISSNVIRTISQDDLGVFWIGTFGGGLNKFDEKLNKFSHFKADSNGNQSILSNLINTVFVDKYKNLWIGTENGGVSFFDVKKEKVILNLKDSPNGLSHCTVNTIYQDENNAVWIGTWDGGLNKYIPSTKEITWFKPNPNIAGAISGKNVKSIIQKEPGFLWISTYGNGLNILNLKTEKFEKVTIDNPDIDNNSQDYIWTSYCDNTNNLWFGTFGKGIYRLNGLKNTFPYFTVKQPNNSPVNVFSVVEDANGTLWIGSLNNGLFLYDFKNKSYSKYPYIPLFNKSINALCLDKNNCLWVGTDEALYMILPDRKTIRIFRHNPNVNSSITRNPVKSIVEDSQGNIWVLFWDAGADFIRKDELLKTQDDAVIFSRVSSILNDKNYPTQSKIWSISKDSKANIWIGLANKLLCYNVDNKSLNSISVGVATLVYEDDFGFYWVGTNGNGLYKLDGNRLIVKNYSYDQGFNCLDILAIQKDKRERLWIGSSCGLSVLEPGSDVVSNFDRNYGLKNFSINFNCSSVLNSGEIFFGGNNGFNVFRAENINKDLQLTPIAITDVKLNNKSIVYENTLDTIARINSLLINVDTLIVDSKEKIITLEFAAINYAIPSAIIYSYMLEGFDKDWIISDAKNRSATYSNLSPGSYTFSVRMTYNKGSWNGPINHFYIIVKPEYWQTLWFKLLVAFSTLAVVSTLLGLIVKRKKLLTILKQKHRFLEDLRKEKELLDIKNSQLNETVEIYNSRIQTMTAKYGEFKNYLNHIYQNMVDLVAAIPEQNSGQFKEVTKSLEEKMVNFSNDIYIDESMQIKNADFIILFAKEYPKLSSTDLRICNLIRQNKANKEIAQELNITSGSLEQSRFRIRKKMALEPEMNLNDLILRF